MDAEIGVDAGQDQAGDKRRRQELADLAERQVALIVPVAVFDAPRRAG